MIKNIYVLCGGISVEHEISLKSAKNIINNLDREKYDIYPVYIDKSGRWSCHEKTTDDIEDEKSLIKTTTLTPSASIGKFLKDDYLFDEDNFFIPAIHGTFGEDGVIQGFLETLRVPYMGCPLLASADCMDKVVTNQIFDQAGIKQAKYLAILISDYDEGKDNILDYVKNKIGYPVFVKPANAGSSVGVTEVLEEKNLLDAISFAFKYDDKVLVEEKVIGRELEVAVMGGDFPVASLPGEHVVTGHEFFNYESKYFDKKTVIKAPTQTSPEEEDMVRKTAIRAYQVMGCRGMARVDIFLREDGEFLVNEINTFPGMTPSSLYPMLWEPTCGMTYSQMLERLIQYGLEDFKTKMSKQRTL